MSRSKSKVHPKYKTKYRGSITLWLSPAAIAVWTPAPTGRRGGPRKFSDVAIETALTLRLVFHLPLRQAEGFLQSLLGLMQLDLDAPDHTTPSRCSRDLEVRLRARKTSDPIHLIVDSTGLSIMGEGEWAAVKHGLNGRRGWKKLHLGVDASGVIVAEIVTDAAYDTRPIYRALKERGATVVVPPTKAAVGARRRRRDSSERGRTITRVRAVGRRRWQKEAGYHR